MILHSVWRLEKDNLDQVFEKAKRSLCDKNPSVMAASLSMFHEIIRYNSYSTHNFADLIPSFVSIIKQVIEHRFVYFLFFIMNV